MLRKTRRSAMIFSTRTGAKELTNHDILLPQGKFRYLRAPIGLNAPSDKWCCKSYIIVEGLTWTKKLVNDTIIWAKTEEELINQTRIVLERYNENNITISKKKFEIGLEIEFAVHMI